MMLSKENIKDIYALSPLQAGMFFHALYEPSSPAFFEQMSYRFRGELNISHVEQSLNELMKRYDILGTVFIQKAAHDPLQVVLKERNIDFRFLDISRRQDKEDYLNNYKTEDRKNVFDLGKDVLMRVAVIRLDTENHEFIWSFHHILMDGWCTSILVSDFFHIYNSFMENRSPRLPGVIPYRTYIDWLGQQDKEKAEEYWKKYLVNYEVPTGVPRLKIHKTNENGYKKGKWHFDLEREKTTALERVAGENNVFLNTVFQAVWGIILGKYNDTKDVVFGAVVSGRPSEIKGVETIVGLFINTVPVRITFEDNTTFHQLLQKVREEAVESAPFHYSQLAEIQSQSTLKPLVDHIFVFENYPTAARIEGLNHENISTNQRAAFEWTRTESFEQTNYDLDLVIGPGELLTISFEYNANVYDDDFIARVAGHLNNVLDQVLHAGAEELLVDEITLLTDEERKQLLIDFNNTETAYPFEKVIQQLFEEQVARTPYHTAVVFENHYLTYQALNCRANQLARRLRNCGVGPGSRVGLLMEPAAEMVTGITAVLKAGSAFVPLDTDSPFGRNRFILEENKPAVVLIQASFSPQNKEWLEGLFSGSVFLIDDESLYTGDASDLEKINTANDTAFVLYTSGTTGRPKGILLTHRNVHNYNLGLRKRAFGQYGEELSFTSLAPFTFDGYGQLIFCALWYGHRFCILPNHYKFEGARILDFYRKYKVDLSDGTPAHIRLMVESLRENTITVNINIKNLIIAGEVLPKKIVKQFLNRFNAGGPDITNCFGPTECCGDTTHYRITKENVDWYETFPIGTPLPNEQVYIVDSKMRLQPIGVFGELCIGGDGVTKGYLNNPELTAEKFDQDFLDDQDEKEKAEVFHHSAIYRTGDLARWLPDGNIEFLGRKDLQVKVRGFRIEPGEIEAQLMNHENIKAAVVTAREDNFGDRYLCAYFVPAHDADSFSLPLLREHLSRQLPEYMIPSYFVPLEKMPLKTNGKVDRKALPDPMGIGLSSGVPYAAPQNEMEEKIVGIWAEVLNREAHTIGIHDNFFELGGNSINILKIAARILDELRLNVSVSILFLHPTVSKMAANIHEQGILSRLECVVKLNKGQNKKNIFIFHPYHGMVYPYKELARLLEEDYNVYGIQARGLVRDSKLPETSQMMVADYIHQIRQVQQEGPFIIAGFCFGSIVAYEIVNQLEAVNCPVEKLILLDEHAFIQEPLVKYLQSRRRKALNALNRLSGVFGKGSVDTSVRDYVREVNAAPAPESHESRRLPEDMEQRKKRIDENNKNLEARGFRISEIIKVPILDIKAEASKGPQFEMKALGKMSEAKVTIIEVPGDHDSIFTQPYVRKVAEIIRNI
jgi:iturin family lipopeptide synthetase C